MYAMTAAVIESDAYLEDSAVELCLDALALATSVFNGVAITSILMLLNLCSVNNPEIDRS